MRREMDRKLEQEKQELQEQLNRELVELEKQEERKYEQKLAQMKKEVDIEAKNSSGLMSHELQEFKQKLESEVAKQLRDHAREQDEIVRKEEDRLEQERKLEL